MTYFATEVHKLPVLIVVELLRVIICNNLLAMVMA